MEKLISREKTHPVRGRGLWPAQAQTGHYYGQALTVERFYFPLQAVVGALKRVRPRGKSSGFARASFLRGLIHTFSVKPIRATGRGEGKATNGRRGW